MLAFIHNNIEDKNKEENGDTDVIVGGDQLIVSGLKPAEITE